MYILNQFFKKLIYYIIIILQILLMKINLEEHLENIKNKLEMEIQKRKEQEDNIKSNGLNELKKLIDISDDYISSSRCKTKYKGVSEKRVMIMSTNPKFHLLYQIIKNQQEDIDELKNIIKNQQKEIQEMDENIGELQAKVFHEVFE